MRVSYICFKIGVTKIGVRFKANYMRILLYMFQKWCLTSTQPPYISFQPRVAPPCILIPHYPTPPIHSLYITALRVSIPHE